MSSTLRELVMTDVARVKVGEAARYANERKKVRALIRRRLGQDALALAVDTEQDEVRIDSITFVRSFNYGSILPNSYYLSARSSRPYLRERVTRLADLKVFFE